MTKTTRLSIAAMSISVVIILPVALVLLSSRADKENPVSVNVPGPTASRPARELSVEPTSSADDKLPAPRAQASPEESSQGSVPAPSAPKRLYTSLRPRLDYESTTDLVSAFGVPETASLNKDDEDAVWSIVRDYQRAWEDLHRLETAPLTRLIEQKFERGEYYDETAYDALMSDPQRFSETRAHGQKQVDGENVYVIVFRREIRVIRMQVELQQEQAFQAAVDSIHAILSKYKNPARHE